MAQIKLYAKDDPTKTTMVEQSTWDKFKTTSYRLWTTQISAPIPPTPTPIPTPTPTPTPPTPAPTPTLGQTYYLQNPTTKETTKITGTITDLQDWANKGYSPISKSQYDTIFTTYQQQQQNLADIEKRKQEEAQEIIDKPWLLDKSIRPIGATAWFESGGVAKWIGTDMKPPEAGVEAAGVKEPTITQHPNAPIGWGLDPTTGKLAKITPTVAPEITPTKQYQILNVEEMKKYSPEQYEKLPTGQVILKEGITPIEGTVKEITPITPPTPTAYQYGATVLDKKANDAAVNTLYQSYFGRNASAAELANWGTQGGADTTVRALEDFLKSERARPEYDVSDIPIKPISQVKKEYEEKIPISEIPTVDDLEDEVPDVTVTDPVPNWETAVNSITGQLETWKAEMKAIYEKQVTDKQAEIDKLTTEIEGYQTKQLETIEKADPSKSQFYTQQTTILQNQLDAAEIESSKLQKDLQDRRNLVAELTVLNETAFADIQAMKGVTGLAAIRTPRINAKIDEWKGRSSILTASIAGVEGNITMAYTVIDAAQADITDRRNEELTYYNALISYYGGLEETTKEKLTTAQTDKKEAAQNIVDMKQTEIDNLEAISTLIKEEMINDPARIAGAGINLAIDTLETITTKLANYDYGVEVQDIKNEQAKEGNKYISSPSQLIGLSEDQLIRQRDSRSREWIFRKPIEEVRERITPTPTPPVEGEISLEEFANIYMEENKVSIDPEKLRGLYNEFLTQFEPEEVVEFTNTQTLKLEQVGLLDAPRQTQLDFLYGETDIKNPFQ